MSSEEQPEKKQKGTGGEWAWPSTITHTDTVDAVPTAAEGEDPVLTSVEAETATDSAAVDEPVNDDSIKDTTDQEDARSPVKLEATGLLNENRQDKWMDNFLQLEKAIIEHGQLGAALAIRGTKLAKWCLNQRMSYKNKEPRMTPERIQLLTQIGFKFTQTASDLKWMAKYQEMVDFKEEHGHLNVSKQQYTKHAQLGEWIYHQIRNHNNGKLQQDRKDLLLKAGMRLDSRKPAAKDWMYRYQQLVEYRQRFGDTNVPKRWQENTSLGSFVFHARKNYQNFLAGKPARGLTQVRLNEVRSFQ